MWSPGSVRMARWACLATWGVGVAACGADETAPSPPVEHNGVLVDSLMLVEADCPAPFIRYADADGDGAGDATVAVELCTEVAGFVELADDCDDLRGDVHPTGVEVCGDGLDNDCSGGDEACAPPDIATDAVTYSRVATDDEFGFSVLGGFDDGANGAALLGAPDEEFGAGTGNPAGLVLQLSGYEEDAAGDRLAFSARQTGQVAGVVNAQLGRSMALGLDGARVYLGTGGPVATPTGTFECAVVWFDEALPADGDLLDDAAGYVGCIADGGLTGYNGVESLAVGLWGDEGHEVLAAPRTSEEVLYVMPEPDGASGDILEALGIRVNLPEGTDYGQVVHWADLDGDGMDDLVATAPARSDAAFDGGGFDVLPGDELRAQEGMVAEVRALDLGLGVAMEYADQHVGVGVTTTDLDGDGTLEVVVSNFEEDATLPASVYVVEIGDFAIYGGDRPALSDAPAGTAWTRLTSGQEFDLFGLALTSVGDELAVGAGGWDADGEPSVLDGAVYTFGQSPDWFASTEHLIDDAAAARIETDVPGEALGTGMSGAGDVNADGRVDLWVTSYGIAAGDARAVLLLNTGL